MTAPLSLVDMNGRPISLDRQLASGGEGTVFTLPNDSSLVAKVYHRPPSTQTIEKLTTMVRLANPQLLALAAWPMSLLYHAKTRHLAGFVMPRLNDCQPIQHLYNPVQRLTFYPRAGWDFQVRAASNLAAAFDEVHKAGGLVGDVNQSNVQVSMQALVRLIDCDSFQIRANGKSYLCEVGVAHYIAPELQGKSLRGLLRTESHDCFGLAVLIYQLLFVGRHPYAGVYQGRGDPSFEQLIAEFRFAQGPAARTWGMAPPPHTPTFADIPSELGVLFRQAFERGSEAGTRPGPARWLAALKRLGHSIAECSADPGHKHWRGASSCVWCRLAERGGPEYFFGVAGSVGAFSMDEAKLQDVLRRLEAIEHGDFRYSRDRFRLATFSSPKPIPPQLVHLWNVAEEKGRQVSLEKRKQALQEEKEEEGRTLRLDQISRQLARELTQQRQALDAELESVMTTVALERRGRRALNGLLLGMTLLGLVTTLFSGYDWAFGIVGGLVALGFGTWFGVFYRVSLRSPGEQEVARIERMKHETRSEAKRRLRTAIEQAKGEAEKLSKARKVMLLNLQEEMQAAARDYKREFRKELSERHQALTTAEQSLTSLENEWRNLTDTCSLECRRIAPRIRGLVRECRSLESQYRGDLERLKAHGEAAARVRHMRLHLIADADIPNVGAGRKQILASYSIFTAADISEQRIRAIKGFGDVLTSNLLGWKKEVLGQFRFNPATDLSPGEQRSITVEFRNRQQQIVAELNDQIGRLESFAPACRAGIQRLAPKIQQALTAYEQAQASVHLLNARA